MNRSDDVREYAGRTWHRVELPAGTVRPAGTEVEVDPVDGRTYGWVRTPDHPR